MRLSKYIVCQPFFDGSVGEDFVLVYSTRSNKLMSLTGDLFSRLEAGHLADTPVALLNRLADLSILVEEDEDELELVVRENLAEAEHSQTFYLVMQPSANCQLGCGYCGQRHEAKLLSTPEIAATIAFADGVLAKGSFRRFKVAWFGAEPLTGLGRVREFSSHFVMLAEKHGVSYDAKMVTNGLLLTGRVAEELVKTCRVRSFEITLDGDAEGHDKRRHTKAGMPTFERIFENIQSVVRRNLGCSLSVRCNTDNRNRERVLPLLHLLKGASLEEKVSFYVAPIHSWGNDAHRLAAEQEEFAEWEIEWFIYMRELGFKVSVLPTRTRTVCMAVDDSAYLIDPMGSVFRCTEVSLVPQYERNGKNVHAIGHITDPASLAKERAAFSSFNHELLAEQEYPCARCNLLPVCGGRCPKEWKEGRRACPPFKYNMNERLLLAYLGSRDKKEKNKIVPLEA